MGEMNDDVPNIWKRFSSSLIVILFLPEHDVDAEYLESLPDNKSINENGTTARRFPYS